MTHHFFIILPQLERDHWTNVLQWFKWIPVKFISDSFWQHYDVIMRQKRFTIVYAKRVHQTMLLENKEYYTITHCFWRMYMKCITKKSCTSRAMRVMYNFFEWCISCTSWKNCVLWFYHIDWCFKSCTSWYILHSMMYNNSKANKN